MDTHVDWLSFSIPTDVKILSIADLYQVTRALTRRIGKHHEQTIFDGTGFDQTTGRPPYRFAMGRDDGGVRIYGGGHLTSVLVEMSGRACEPLRDFQIARGFIAGIMDGITRLDVAVDVRTGTLPSQFTNARSHTKFRTISFIRSDTGETCYVGSPKSDRFCRVYRYNPPHPRSELLRIEYVFRRELAKITAQYIVDQESWLEFLASAGNTYGWNHRDYNPGLETDLRMRAPIISKSNESTVGWLYKQVAPALKRLIAEDAINMADFLEYVYSNEE